MLIYLQQTRGAREAINMQENEQQFEEQPKNTEITQEDKEWAERFVLQNNLGIPTDEDFNKAEYEIELMAAKELAINLIAFRKTKIKKGKLFETAVDQALERFGIEHTNELKCALIAQICIEISFGEGINITQGGETNTN